MCNIMASTQEEILIITIICTENENFHRQHHPFSHDINCDFNFHCDAYYTMQCLVFIPKTELIFILQMLLPRGETYFLN